MVNKERTKKAIAISFAALVILLIFTVLIPPAAGVELSIGDRSPSSVKKGGIITFSDVNITIEAIERIPFVELNFSIFKGDTLKDSVRFYVNGTKIVPSSEFTITLIHPNPSVLASWHTSGTGYDISYGEYWGSTQGDGYGYGDSGAEQITISYQILFDTDNLAKASGYYGKFFGNATLNSNTIIYNSTPSDTFSVTQTTSSGGGGGGVVNIPPTADAGGPYVGSTEQPISFDAGESYDSDGTIVGYKWDFTTDGVYDTDWLSNPTTSHSYGSAGTYTAEVMVKDDAGATHTDTTTVTITGAGHSEPIANAGGPYTGITSESVRFDGSKSYDPDGTIENYTWDFGDGSKAYTQNPQHLYPNEGEYSITLTVTDNVGLSDQDTSTIKILLDTDQDGWSDILEIAYGTSETDPTDEPADNDNDGIPDNDSPDGSYIGDSDDDNDGVADDTEKQLGSDPYDATDVIDVQIEGTTYYLVDTTGNGESDTLFNPYSADTSPIQTDNGNLLLDIDDDGTYEYLYDPATGESTVNDVGQQEEEFPFVIIIVLIIVIIIITIGILFKTGYLYVENVEDSNKKKK
jgi:PKD repeat protein